MTKKQQPQPASLVQRIVANYIDGFLATFFSYGTIFNILLFVSDQGGNVANLIISFNALILVFVIFLCFSIIITLMPWFIWGRSVGVKTPNL